MSETLERQEFGVIFDIAVLSMSAPMDKMVIFENKRLLG